MFAETFFACLRQFYFLTQTKYFAWAIAFASWPFLAIFKMLSFSKVSCFFKRFSTIELLNVFVKPFFRIFEAILFLDPN